MQVKLMAAPARPAETSGQSQSSQDARSRAMAKLMGSAPAQVNQNAVSPEEMGAIRQNDTNEVVSEDTQIQEAPKPTELETKPTEDSLSSQHAALIRREKAARAQAQKREQDFRAKETALAAREAALAVKDQEYQTNYVPKDRLKQNTLQVLAEQGLSYDQLTQQLINQEAISPQVKAYMDQMEAKLKALEDKASQGEKAVQEQQTAQYQAAIRQITTDVQSLVASNPEFETIKASRSTKDVVDLIERTFNEEGVMMSVEEAAQQVEDYLVEQIEKYAKLTKIQKRLTPASTQAASPAQTPGNQRPQTQPMKTLTNTVGSSRQMSAKERAIAAFKGQLK